MNTAAPLTEREQDLELVLQIRDMGLDHTKTLVIQIFVILWNWQRRRSARGDRLLHELTAPEVADLAIKAADTIALTAPSEEGPRP
jgi:hypothetical protein